jgi:hypothetical protein
LVLKGQANANLLLLLAQVMFDSRIRAAAEPLLLHKNWVVATLVFALWCLGVLVLEDWLISSYGTPQLQHWQVAVVGGTGGVLVAVFVAWAVLRSRHEQKRREAVEAAGGALLFGYDSSDDEEV